jgi:hypothetical protein
MQIKHLWYHQRASVVHYERIGAGRKSVIAQLVPHYRLNLIGGQPVPDHHTSQSLTDRAGNNDDMVQVCSTAGAQKDRRFHYHVASVQVSFRPACKS